MSDPAGGPSLDEGDVGRRRRRRRRRRGGERSFGENLPQDAPQPTDDGLAVGGRNRRRPPGAEWRGRRVRQARSAHAKKTAIVARDARAASEIVSLSDRTAKPCAKRERQASTRPPRSRSRKNSPHPKQTIPKLRRPPATRPPPERRLPSRREPRLMKPASSRRRLPRLRSLRSRSRARYRRGANPWLFCARGGQQPSLSQRQPPAPAKDEPPRPRRSGWWQRARASVIGE